MNELRITHVFENPLGIVLIPEPPALPAAWVSATFQGFTLTAKGPAMAYTLQDGLQVLLKVEFLDAGGNHAKVDGDPRWSSSNPENCTVTVTPGNPYLATLLGVQPGEAQVIVEADADLDEGEERQIVCTMDVSIVAGEAVVGVISPSGEPSPPSPGGPG